MEIGLRLVGKVALVTGAARGIGCAISARFVQEGGRVLMTDILENEGQLAARSLGDSARFLKHDVTNPEDWEHAVRTAESEFGKLTCLVNNAGTIHVSPLESYSIADYRRVIEINQTGVFLGMKSALAALKRSNGATIVNMSSVNGLRGDPQTWAYTASKFAVRGLTKVAAKELAPFNIRANSIHPGPFDTPMAASVAGNVEEAARGMPAGRFGDPREIASLVALLASDEATFMTGAELVIDGGLMA